MIRLLLSVLIGSALSTFAQSTGTFVATGSMTMSRASHTATLLQDGRVLITGGVNASSGYAGTAESAELYDPSTGRFTATGNMTTNRAGHTATLLHDGRVLVSGEYTGDGTSELYYPGLGAFIQTGGNTDIHSSQVSNLLSNGKVLITGPPSAEIYDPASASDIRLGLLDHGTGAVVLKDDKLVIVGGSVVSLFDVTGGSLKLLDRRPTTEVYDQTAILLAKGKVLMAGGHLDAPGYVTTDEAALYDPRRGTVDSTGDLRVSRTSHTATLLPGGRVLIHGGRHFGANPQEVRRADAEEYNPDTGSFTDAGHGASARVGHTATLLLDGTVLIAGGSGDTSAELYIPPLRAASAASLSGPLAPESLGSIFGSRLALATEVANDALSSLPTTLGGISLRIRNSSGAVRLAPLLYVSPSQINFEVPAGTAPGSVALEVLNAPSQLPKVEAQVNTVAPGLFTFEDNTPVAYALRIEPDGKQTALSVRNTIILDDRPVYLVLYATGIRYRSLSATARATIGGIEVPVEYAGAEGSGWLTGVDQINIRLTPALKDLGVSNLTVTVDGIPSNTVSVDIR